MCIKDTRFNSNILKGILILTVLVNHFVNSYGNLSNSAGFANLAISGFFILSGYGLYHSLNRSTKDKQIDSSLINKFYFEKFLKIFVPYSFYLIVLFLLGNQIFADDIFIMKFTGLNWFISSLIICYLAAPFIFYLIKRKLLRYILISLLVVIIVFSFLMYAVDLESFIPGFISHIMKPPYAFRRIFLLPIMLFCAGMFLNLFKLPNIKYVGGIISVALYGFILVSTNLFLQTSENNLEYILVVIMFMLSSLIFVKYFVDNVTIKSNFFSKSLSVIGIYSIYLYLFHMFYFQAVEILINNTEITFFTMLFPTLLYLPFFIIWIFMLSKICDLIFRFLKKENNASFV